MANFPTLSGKTVYDPGVYAQEASRLRGDLDGWGKANSYSCPLGKDPGSAWLLMTRADVAALDRNASQSLTWKSDFGNATFSGLYFVRSFAVLPQYNEDPNSLHLVEFQDVRRILRLSCINEQYNVRMQAPSSTSGADLYYSESLNTGSLWTWQTMLDDIWDELPAAPAAPTLPYSPDGSPEGFQFIGVCAWDALHVVLGKIGCTTALDPTAGTISYVRLGQTQTGLAAAQTALAAAGRAIYDYDPLSANVAYVPETIRVFFRRKDQEAGIEKDTPRTGNWIMDPVHTEDVATSVTGAASGSVICVWDDLPALHDEADNVDNSSDLSTRATEVATNLINSLQDDAQRDRLHYSGVATTILPGTEVSEVVWRDYGDGGGLVTEIRKRPMEAGKGCGAGGYAGERLAPPDFSRFSHPVYPARPQLVQVYDSGESAGASITANASGLVEGRVMQWYQGSTANQDACWLCFIDDFDNAAGAVSVVNHDYFVGRLSGIDTDTGDTRPVYLCRKGELETLTWENQGSTTITAYGVIEITGIDTDGVLEGQLPEFPNSPAAAVGPQIWAINGGTSVANTATGTCSFGIHKPVRAQCGHASHTAVNGEFWGPAAATQDLDWGRPYFTIIGDVENGGTANQTAMVIRSTLDDSYRFATPTGSGDFMPGDNENVDILYKNTAGNWVTDVAKACDDEFNWCCALNGETFPVKYMPHQDAYVPACEFGLTRRCTGAANISSGGSGTVTIVDGPDVTAYLWAEDSTNITASASETFEGWVTWDRLGEKWYLWGVSCNAL